MKVSNIYRQLRSPAARSSPFPRNGRRAQTRLTRTNGGFPRNSRSFESGLLFIEALLLALSVHRERETDRNPSDSRACPVTAILAWLAIGGHAAKGPLFGNLEPKAIGGQMYQAHHKEMVTDAKLRYEVWFDAEGNRVNYTSAQVYGIFTRIIDRCAELEPPADDEADNWDLLSPHDWRVAFVAWVARCKGEEHAARTGARFAQCSTDLGVYWDLGANQREQFLNNKITDPIFAFCPFPANGVTFGGAQTRSYRGGRTRKRRQKKKPTAPA